MLLVIKFVLTEQLLLSNNKFLKFVTEISNAFFADFKSLDEVIILFTIKTTTISYFIIYLFTLKL